MTPQEEFQELQEEIESLKKQLAMSEGAMAEQKKQLAQFNCKTLKEARELLKTLQSEQAKMKEAYEHNLREYRDQRNRRTSS